MVNHNLINKTLDFDDLQTEEAKKIIGELDELVALIKERDLKISSWYGKFNLRSSHRSPERINRGYGYEGLGVSTDDKNFPWFLYWEIIWLASKNEFVSGQKVLDLGGSSSLFSYYLASKGLEVTAVDLDEDLVRNGNIVAEKMNWDLKNYVMDLRDLDFSSTYDHITSVCVFEHIPMYERIKINKKIKSLLVKGGKFSITFDYRNPCRSAGISSPSDVYTQFIEPSGLQVRGNKQFMDNGKNYLLQPFYYNKRLWLYKLYRIYKRDFNIRELFDTKYQNDYTFGALFMERKITKF